jgi:hypothetical protein
MKFFSSDVGLLLEILLGGASLRSNSKLSIQNSK